MDFIQQLVTASSVAEPRSSKAFPKAKGTPKKSERKETWSHLHVHKILRMIPEGPSHLAEEDYQALIWPGSLVFHSRTLKPKEVVARLGSPSP